MEKSHLRQHPKFHADKASDHDNDCHSDDDYNFSNMSVSSSFYFYCNEKHILEEAYDEKIGIASLFQEETNNNHLDDKHNIGSNADGSTVDATSSQPPPTVSACSSRLTHSDEINGIRASPYYNSSVQIKSSRSNKDQSIAKISN